MIAEPKTATPSPEEIANSERVAKEISDSKAEEKQELAKTESLPSPPMGRPGDGAGNGLSRMGKVWVFLALFAWLGVFMGGITVDSRPFRYVISESGLKEAIGDEILEVVPYDGPFLFAVGGAYLFYTPTNLAVLTLLAGLLGTLGRKASLHPASAARRLMESDPIDPKLSALLRSFLVYLFFLSGVLVFADEPFSSPTPGSYLRLAGLMSLFAFAANYSPSFFASILADIHDFIQSRRQTEAAR